MKNTLKTICFLLILVHINCKAQIVPLNNIDSPNGAYEKDLDNVLPFWVDTWKGNVNNKEYTFQFTIFTQHQKTFSNGDYYYADMLMIKLKVVDLNSNLILYDNLNSSNFENYKIRLLAYRLNEFSFYFMDDETNCNNSAKFILLKSDNNPDQIEYKDFKYGENIYLDCPYDTQTDIPMFLPTEDFILTRQ